MVTWPWNSDDGASDEQTLKDEHLDAVEVCEFQDGTLAVYEDRVLIDRSPHSSFDDLSVPVERLFDVDFDEGIAIGYLQLELTDTPADTGGFMSAPVNERTLHFGRRQRPAARQARDALVERAEG